MTGLILCFCSAAVFAQGIVIDHTCTDLDEIPQVWISAVQNSIQSHYAHTSHGGQLTYGVEFIEDGDSFYDCEIGYCSLPTVAGAYCVFDGQEGESYVTPDLYWETSGGLNLTRAVLDNNPAIDTSMWGWCSQCDYYTQAQVQDYLDAMSLLESEYPGVTFIYFTGNAQGTGSEGYNRYLRNNQIRDYCAVNDKVLFDFADIDSWWLNPSTSQWEHNTYSYNSTEVPSEHPQYYGDEYAHTTAESCINKGVAWWWMMAVLAGWSSSGIEEQEASEADGFEVLLPNPSSVPVQVSVDLSASANLELNVYDTTGRIVTKVFSGQLPSGESRFSIEGLSSGVYFMGINSGEIHTSRLMVIVN